MDLDVLDGLPFITKQDKTTTGTDQKEQKISEIDRPKVHEKDLKEGEDPKQDIAYDKEEMDEYTAQNINDLAR